MGTLNERGSVLILSLWVMTLMMLTAASLAYRAGIELRLSRYQWDEIRLVEEAKITARERAADHVLADDRYGLEDESSRIDLNRAPQEVLEKLFISHPEIVQAVLQWRTPLNKAGRGQGDEYTSLGYAARRGPFKSVEELLLVKNMTPEIFQDMRDYLTIGGPGGVNINTASARVLEAVGLQPSLVSKIVRQREGRSGSFESLSDVTAQLKKNTYLSEEETANLATVLQQNRLKSRSDAVRLRWVAHLPNSSAARRFEIVATGRSIPSRILSWRENAQ